MPLEGAARHENSPMLGLVSQIAESRRTGTRPARNICARDSRAFGIAQGQVCDCSVYFPLEVCSPDFG